MLYSKTYHTVNIGFNDIGFNDKSLITTHFACQKISQRYIAHTIPRVQRPIENDTLNLATYFLCLLHANRIGYYDFWAVCTVDFRKVY